DQDQLLPTLPVISFHVWGWNPLTAYLAAARDVPPAGPASAALIRRAGVMRDLCERVGVDEGVLERLRDARVLADAGTGYRQVRTLLDLYCDGNVRYINFYGPPRTIHTVSYLRVLEAARSPSSAPSSFKDKAVFIGYSAATSRGQDRVRDDYRTVYSGARGLDISGVEVAATAFANLVDDSSLRTVGQPWALAFVGLWGLLIGL